MNADLHCHSSISDGVLAPAELVHRAVANRVEMLALTDHDELSGLMDARRVAVECGLRFVDGVEISVSWEGTTIHVLGLRIDPTDPNLASGLERLRDGRCERAKRMASALESIGLAGTLEGAGRHAANPALIGRTHFARHLVERGVAKDVRGVFEHYLARGKPGFVGHDWASLEQATAWISGAGGISVLAHPGRYRVAQSARDRLLGQFRDLGGSAIEVVSGSHAPEQVRDFARLARRFGLLASCGSDFHAPAESPVDLGRNRALPDGTAPLWRVLA